MNGFASGPGSMVTRVVLSITLLVGTTGCEWCELIGTCEEKPALLVDSLPAGEVLLSVEPVFQETPVWCWVTVGEMVFRYYGVPPINPISYQCGLIAPLNPICDFNCLNCLVPAGDLTVIRNMIQQYPIIAAQQTQTVVRPLTAQISYAPLSRRAVVQELEEGRPVIAAINTSGYWRGPWSSEHVAVIAGYRSDGTNLWLIVNDPFPFNFGAYDGMGDPYLSAGAIGTRAGQYQISYEAFRTRLVWAQTIYRIQ